tara:strand:+ start:444 stop:566 length:123 start_codon:yes stop_codon:yes gene_type:complete
VILLGYGKDLSAMDGNQIQVLPFFIITFAILISGFTVVFT